MFTSAKGSRPNVPKIVIVFTRGYSSDKMATKDEAKLLKTSGALVLTVGIGAGVNDQELQAIATLPDDVFIAATYDVLDAVHKEATERICERGK